MFAHAAKAIIRSSIGRAIIQIAACGTGIVALCVATTGALTLAAGGTLKQALFAAAISFAQIGAYGYIHGAIEGLKGATLVAVKSACTPSSAALCRWPRAARSEPGR